MTNPNDKASDCTKLEHFAAMAMQGLLYREEMTYDDGPACCDGGSGDNLCGCQGAHQWPPRDYSYYAHESVFYALALIAELNKQAESASDIGRAIDTLGEYANSQVNPAPQFAVGDTVRIEKSEYGTEPVGVESPEELFGKEGVITIINTNHANFPCRVSIDKGERYGTGAWFNFANLTLIAKAVKP